MAFEGACPDRNKKSFSHANCPKVRFWEGPTPLAILPDIKRVNKHNLPGRANQLVQFGLGFEGDKHQKYSAVRRGERYLSGA